MSALWSKKNDDAQKQRNVLIDLLEDIRDQRAKLKVEFEGALSNIQSVNATLLDYNLDGMTVEVSQIAVATHAFDGVAATCYVRLRDRSGGGRGREQFLSFETRVRQVVQRPSGQVHFLLNFPENLKSAQLRKSVRVKVDGRKVPELTIWPDFSGWTDLSRIRPVFSAEQIASRKVKADNFSANGLRLLVNTALLHELLPELTKGTRFAVSFTAVSEPGQPAANFWVSAVLRNVFADTQTGETALGFEFTAEGFRDEKDGMVWKPLKFDEVSGLGKFVFKWNLDLYREKGMA